jgi:DNA-binding NarL/FixJ family response regulator
LKKNKPRRRNEDFMEPRIRILILDDRERVRQSLRALLQTFPGIDAIAEAKNGCAAFDYLEEFQPDVVVIGVQHPDREGLDAIRLFKKYAPRVTVIALSLYADVELAARAAGADVFVSQGEPPEKLLETLGQIVAKRSHDSEKNN